MKLIKIFKTSKQKAFRGKEKEKEKYRQKMEGEGRREKKGNRMRSIRAFNHTPTS